MKPCGDRRRSVGVEGALPAGLLMDHRGVLAFPVKGFMAKLGKHPSRIVDPAVELSEEERRRLRRLSRTPYAAGGTYHVFLSFSGQQSRDAAGTVARWIEELLHTTVRVFFYGPESASIGESWMDHVYDGAEDSDAFISFLTRENLDRHWVNAELKAVESSARCKLILLILLDGLQPGDLPSHMQSRQAKPWSRALLKNLLVLLGREARIENIEAVVKAQGASIDASFMPDERPISKAGR